MFKKEEIRFQVQVKKQVMYIDENGIIIFSFLGGVFFLILLIGFCAPYLRRHEFELEYEPIQVV